ncbi:MAG: preprotein translocase subunit SecY [Rickettsiaceae bacterium H1]|nr:preprotein translocase subunit SecY [Rickettsiaceae bacterium H1]
MYNDVHNIFKLQELIKRILFSIFALIIYRFGTYLTIPGINNNVLQRIVENYNSGFLGMFNMFSGGALSRMTIFALNVMPYIISSIIIQLLSVNISVLNNLRQEGDFGRKRINFYTRALTVIFCIIQAFFIVMSLKGMDLPESIILPDIGMPFALVAVVTLLGGTMFLMWLGEQITAYGIGNGVSLIIVTGILAELPGAISSFFALGKIGSVSILVVILVILFFLMLLWMIIYVEQSYRKIFIQYPRKQVGRRLYSGDSSYIPLKINMSGVIPPIFANALLMFPITIANFFPNSSISSFIILYFFPGNHLYILMYFACIVFFCFFYVGFVFNVEETAYNLKKNGGFVLGKRPGKDTVFYLEHVLTKITVIGAIYLSVICVIPELIRINYSIPFIISGTSLLIIVNVIVDIFSQVQTYLFTRNYSKFSNKVSRY